MKALSLWQPWANLMSHDFKRVETRSWRYSGRMPVEVAIHASKRRFTGFDYEVLLRGDRGHHYRQALDLMRSEPFPYGAIVAVGTLCTCRPALDVREALLTEGGKGDDAELAFGDYREGRWAWLFQDLRRLRAPIYLRGYQGVWNLTPAMADKVQEQLR